MIAKNNKFVTTNGVLRQEAASGLSLATCGGSRTALYLADVGFVQGTDIAEQGSDFPALDLLGLDTWPMVSLRRDCS